MDSRNSGAGSLCLGCKWSTRLFKSATVLWAAIVRTLLIVCPWLVTCSAPWVRYPFTAGELGDGLRIMGFKPEGVGPLWAQKRANKPLDYTLFFGSHRGKPLRSSISLSTSSFGASLYKSLISGNQDNIIFSPFSAFTSLAMLYLGARGDTKQELRTALAIQRRQNVQRDLLTIFNSLITDDPDANVTLRIANALYYDPAQVEILDSYESNISTTGRVPRPFRHRTQSRPSAREWGK